MERKLTKRTGPQRKVVSSLAGYWGFVKDPIHGYIRISETEKKIIDTRPLQRLRRIRQLAGSEYVYPAANHTRFEHVLGSMYLAGVLGDTLPTGLSQREREELRIAALVHDIGHGPFSHIFEPLTTRYLSKTHEDFVPWLVTKTELAEVLEEAGFEPKKLGRLAIGHLADQKHPYLDQVISSSIDVDKMDFLVRDSFHTGAGYGSIDVYRLLYSMDILDGNLAVEGTAIAALESFLLARLESFRTIYFHRASRAVQIMLVKALDLARDELGLLKFDDPADFLRLDDYGVWAALRESKKSHEIIEDIEMRRLLKCTYERTLYTTDESVSNVITKASVRHDIQKEIARKARVPDEDVIIDVPTLSSVPYQRTVGITPFDVPVFFRTHRGRNRQAQLAEVSRIGNVLRGFMNLVRVYTKQKYRDRVETASKQVLGETPPLSSRSAHEYAERIRDRRETVTMR